LQNSAEFKLLLPFPEIHGLRFAREVGKQESEWYSQTFVPPSGAGFILQSGEGRCFEWRVRPRDVAPPDEYDQSDYYRWHVDLSPGAYQVWFQWRVDKEFFDPNSPWGLPQLQNLAHQQGASVWLGEVLSNRLPLTWP
jgi:hypothetical protein